MASKLGATFVPGSDDDYFMPEVVAPSPQRVTPQVPQNMQEDLQRMELEAREVHDYNRSREPSLSTYTGQKPDPRGYGHSPSQSQSQSYSQTRTTRLPDMDEDAPSFSPFPKVVGDNVPPADDEKENILWKARNHVLHSQNVNMQITWARDVLNWAEISLDAAAREAAESGNRPPTPRKEHELRNDAVNIIRYLAEQEHPDALYIRAKWLEFGKFGERVDKREAYSGYKKASDLGSTRSVYRMGMLFEQSNDMSKAKEYYYKGLSLKDSAALYRMGMMSLLGQHGETKDYQGGLERIRAAADSADEDAPQGAYVYGMLIGRDLPDISIPEGILPYAIETSKVYVEKAAYLGFAKAQLKMGQAYELCQLGCDFNPSYSLHYYGLAAKQGIPEAALGVSRWFLFGYEGVFKKNEELAFKYAHEAASAKLPTGEFAMGYYHEIGIHVNKDVVEAQRWYQLAADHGNKDAVGRLESLSQGGGLSKQDHETTTLGRIKSQHGSMRGKRPDRFAKQNNPMPTLSEGDGPAPLPKLVTSVGNSRVSPLPSPGMRPTIVTENNSFAEPSRASFVDTADRQPAFNIRVDPNAPPMRSQSAAPYPVDDRMQPPRNAPYPDDDGRPRLNNNYPPNQGPSADRPGSAFGPATCIRLVGRAAAVAEADRPMVTDPDPEATDRQEADLADLAKDAHTQETADLEAPTAGTACRTDHPRDMVVPEARWAALMEDQSPGSSLLEPHHDRMGTPINSITPAVPVVPGARVAQEARVAISQKGWDLSPAKVDHHQEESRPEAPLPDMDPDPGLKVLEADPLQVPTELALLLRDLLLSTAQVLHQALARLLLQPRPSNQASNQASKDPQRLKTWEFRRVNKTAIV
ncbi:uncharacterized protein Triagg1_8174 [Trichoderma aggressivum f. europaeum]|uniref:Chitin synthase activator n=1 Tax=Trichoderma aggressivum f. europaeum TaxID=173218 RepID=A0AAE1IA96_9HYPO|nr:hypothetical protein Triagg1_8174 [Trichoderma aggressivum f. europaeum]